VPLIAQILLFSCQPPDKESDQRTNSDLTYAVDTPTKYSVFDDENKENFVSPNFAFPQNGIGITQDEAASLCRTVLGEKEEETGFDLAYLYIATVEIDGNEYYVIHRSWLVDNNHWSYIGYAIVSVAGDRIYEGTIDNEGYYCISGILWEKRAFEFEG